MRAPSRPRPGPIPIAPPAVALLLLALALAPAPAEEPAKKAAERLLIEDPETKSPRRRIHDVRRISVEAREGALQVACVFREPLARGTFQSVRLYVDCDDDPKSGIDGADLYVRAAVGSRYRPSYAPAPAEGLPAPFDIQRGSCARATVKKEADSVGSAGKSGGYWLTIADAPLKDVRVEADQTIRFSVPLRVLADCGLRYNTEIALRFDVEGTCSEELLSVDYRADGPGRKVLLDGRDDEWGGEGAAAEDITGELHPDTNEVDLEALLVGHDGADVTFLVRLASAGFGEDLSHLDDIRDRDEIFFGIEPIGGTYMKYEEFSVWTKEPVQREGTARWCVAPRRVEAAFRCPPEQRSFRIHVWADAERHDDVPDEGMARLSIPASAWGRK